NRVYPSFLVCPFIFLNQNTCYNRCKNVTSKGFVFKKVNTPTMNVKKVVYSSSKNLRGKNHVQRVAIYVRVSTEEQAEHGYSIDAQLETLRNYCNMQGK